MAYSVPTSTPDFTVNPDNTLLTAFVNAQKQKNATLAQQLMQEGSAVSPVYSAAQGMSRLGMAALGGLYGNWDAQAERAKLLSEAKIAAGVLNNYNNPNQMPPGAKPATGHENDDEDEKPGKQASAAPGEHGDTFIKTVQAGGLTNPNALAVVGAFGQAESGYNPAKIAGAWSDPSESGGAGTSGGALSWRNERLDNLRKFAATNGQQGNGDTATQAKFFLQENPELITALNNAKSPEEAHDLMSRAWQYAGYNRPGQGEYQRRLDLARSYAPRFAGGGEQNQAPAASDPYDPRRPLPRRQKAAEGDVALPEGVNTEYSSLPGGSSNPIDAAVGPGSANAVDAVKQAGSSVSSAPVPPERPAGLGGSAAISPSPGPQALASALSQYNVNPNASDAGAKAFAADPSNRGPQYAAALTGKPLASPQAAPQAAPQAPAQYASLPPAAPAGGAPQAAPAPVQVAQGPRTGATASDAAAPSPTGLSQQQIMGAVVLSRSDNPALAQIGKTVIQNHLQQSSLPFSYQNGLAQRDHQGNIKWILTPDQMKDDYQTSTVNGVPVFWEKGKSPATAKPFAVPGTGQVDLTPPTLTKPDGSVVPNPNYVARQGPNANAQQPFKAATEINFGDKANTQLDKNIIDDIQLSKQKAMGSVGTLTAINRQKESLDKGTITGWGADWQTSARGLAAKLLGIEDVPLTESQKFDAAANQKGSELAKQISNAGHTTNADLQIGKIIAGGDRSKTEAAIKAIVDAQEKLAVKQIELHNKSVDKFAKVVPDAASRAEWYRVETPEIYQYGQNKAEGAATPKRLRYNPATGALE